MNFWVPFGVSNSIANLTRHYDKYLRGKANCDSWCKGVSDLIWLGTPFEGLNKREKEERKRKIEREKEKNKERKRERKREKEERMT